MKSLRSREYTRSALRPIFDFFTVTSYGAGILTVPIDSLNALYLSLFMYSLDNDELREIPARTCLA